MSSTVSRKVNPVTGLTMADCAFLEAYQRLKSGPKAYAELHPDANEKTCSHGGKSILEKPAIVAYLAKIQVQARIAAGCTLADHLNSLAILRNLAMKEHRYRDAIYAEELRGKASGLYTVNVHLHHQLTPEVIAAIPWDQLDEQELAQIEAGKATDELLNRVITRARIAATSSSS